MQTIQFKVDDNYLNIILTLLNSLKKDMVRELKIIKNSKVTNSSLLKSEEQIKLDRVKGILKNRISDPMEYQRGLRDEWEREQIMKYLLDTNILIYYLNGDKTAIDFVDKNLKSCAISSITYLEILVYPYEEDEEKEVIEFLELFEIYDVSREIIDEAI